MHCSNIYTLVLCCSDGDVVENGAKCYDESGKLVGKFVTRQGNLGLAILRISDMLVFIISMCTKCVLCSVVCLLCSVVCVLCSECVV